MNFQTVINTTNGSALPPSSSSQPMNPSDQTNIQFSNHEWKTGGRKGKRWCESGQDRNHSDQSDATEIPRSPISPSLPPNDEDIYSCTFCLKMFKSEFDWRRHETGVHEYSEIEWPCPFHDSSLVGKLCVFCPDMVQNMAHYTEIHGMHLCLGPWIVQRSSSLITSRKPRRGHVCLKQSIEDSTFRRKDLLAQHIQGMHLRSAEAVIQQSFKVPKDWSRVVDVQRVKPDALWCGFCQMSLTSVSDRMSHVADHFRDGFKMGTWVSRSTSQACPASFRNIETPMVCTSSVW
jgi:hypothetical protein